MDETEKPCCQNPGPGYPTPLAATKGPKESLIYVVCIQTVNKSTKHDYLATVDVDPSSKTYSKVIHRLPVKYFGDELHHTGWNACSSCYGDTHLCRDKFIMPCLNSDRIYIVDIGCNQREPKMCKIVEPEEIRKFNSTVPHTVHCVPSGDIMISCMGDLQGNGRGSFILLDGKCFTVKGNWGTDGCFTEFGYDFWYQPRHNVMVSTEWGAPSAFKKGFSLADVTAGKYGHHLHFWDWTTQKHFKSIDLGQDGMMPLEIRFLHNPVASYGYVGCALSSNVFRFYKDDCSEWQAQKVISVPSLKVEGWVLPEMPGLITDILISMDDKFLFFSNWAQGDIRQYDISKPDQPKLVGQLSLGGLIYEGGPVKVIPTQARPKRLRINKKTIMGGPQMLQCSLDGKRLYVTNSLFSPWDKEFYPEVYQKGSVMLQIDVDTEKGGLKPNPNFLIDFADEPDGPVLAHEMRYPGGDCTSDIWL